VGNSSVSQPISLSPWFASTLPRGVVDAGVAEFVLDGVVGERRVVRLQVEGEAVVEVVVPEEGEDGRGIVVVLVYYALPWFGLDKQLAVEADVICVVGGQTEEAGHVIDFPLHAGVEKRLVALATATEDQILAAEPVRHLDDLLSLGSGVGEDVGVRRGSGAVCVLSLGEKLCRPHSSSIPVSSMRSSIRSTTASDATLIQVFGQNDLCVRQRSQPAMILRMSVSPRTRWIAQHSEPSPATLWTSRYRLSHSPYVLVNRIHVPSMRTAVLLEPSEFELQDRPRPSPGPDDVLVNIRDVGICGSDVHYYEHGRIGNYVVEDPSFLVTRAPAKSSRSATTSMASNPATASPSNPASRAGAVRTASAVTTTSASR